MATTAIAALSQLIHEELSLSKKDLEPGVDGIFEKMYTSSAGVERDVGRTWQKILTFVTGLAGSFKNVDIVGHGADARATGQVHNWDASPRVYPGLTNQPFSGSVQKKITLVEGMGTMHIPIHHLQVDRLDAAMGQTLSRLIRGTAKRVAMDDARCYYTNDATVKPIWKGSTTIADSVPTNTNTTTVHSFGGDAVGRIGRLAPGDQVDARDVSDANDDILSGGIGGIVTKVDYIGKTFSVIWSGTVTFGDLDYITQHGSLETDVASTFGPSGAETWLVNSGTVFNLSLTTHPQFKSLIVAAGGAVMEENFLNKYCGGFYDAYGGMYDLDSIITTTGVATAWLDSLDGLGRFARNGKALTVKGGWMSMGYVYNGKEFEMLISRFQAGGQAYICKMGENNLRRCVPPPMSGTGGMNDFAGEIQFVAPLMGSATNFLPHYDSGLTQFIHAPFSCFREWYPEQIPGIKVTGLAEINP